MSSYTLSITKVTLLISAKCGNPRLIDYQIIVFSFMEPALEESTVTFACPGEHVLSGPNASICKRNGEWEPDPKQLTCSGILL